MCHSKPPTISSQPIMLRLLDQLLKIWSRTSLKAQHPLQRCAILTICIFVLFIAEGVAAVAVHDERMLHGTAAFHGTIVLCLLLYLCWTIWVNGQSQGAFDVQPFRSRNKPGLYDANLCSTILTCLTTIIACSVLYPLVWYPALNEDVLTQAVQDKENVRLPAVAFVSINLRSDFYRIAQLYDHPPPKAFLTDITGKFRPGVPQCASQTSDEILASHYCNCTEMFSKVLEQPPPAYVEGFSYQTFTPVANIAVNSTNTSLVLQVFPRHNTSEVEKGYPKPGPTLLFMLHDPDIAFVDAFENELVSTVQLPMLAATTVMASPIYRMGWGRKPYHYYSQPEQLTRWEWTAQWVFAQAGGFFAIFQLLAWIASGMAVRRELGLPFHQPI
ncbi:hypothetical protein AC578_11053 [Pseudocercospora eumusae]|uniref:Uncharacterized protein n=1 Tax=Pseudocercospora eumusae TaxID=321146 RepID=A0A139HS90_9PEZI|nr:hypothetical protein AC578_11053 [Pseudocercospora eumusae]